MPPTDVQLGSLAGEIRDGRIFSLINLLRAERPDRWIDALGAFLALGSPRRRLADAIAARIDPAPAADVGGAAGRAAST